MARTVPLESFQEHFGNLVELSSEALGGQVLDFSDEFFSPASDLLKVPPPISKKGQFGPNGALFDGWETRRHNPNHDWVIIRLGPPSGTIVGLDIDTGHFSGNEGPAASVMACFMQEGTPTSNSEHWQEILPISPLGPASRHLFLLADEYTKKPFTHVKLLMHPDGGIGRFRVYGNVVPLFPEPQVAFDLAHSFNGGRCVAVSDQHYGVGANLLLSGRGKDMGDGWETKRSRKPGHTDWVIVKLGAPGYLDWTEIDTAHFLGNFPESVDLYATQYDNEIPPADAEWELILPRTKTGPHRQHCLQLQQLSHPVTHVRMTIYPDGGVKRLRLIGRRAVDGVKSEPSQVPQEASTSVNGTTGASTASNKPLPNTKFPTIPALPLTPEAFAAYGHVIQAYPNPHHVPKGTKVVSANFGSALKFNHLSPITALPHPTDANAVQAPNFSVYHCTPTQELGGPSKAKFEVRVLEKHEYSSQSFIPLGGGSDRYLVIVALPGQDGQPDLQTLRAFTASSSQGFTYAPNVWHHPMIALDRTTDFACITNETGDAKVDCEILEYGKTVMLVEQP
ncbi:Allantoicase [Cystobasidium minutum MCA 4210]|uniref:Allantoicase n=1 Tax=Cystobasidium minutum MCA 4210 TaxID=1397322 RepID=UPI0034CE8D3F|eukprot:jgi/Rhomi1/148630/estExt_Genewise1.C_1_t10351